MNGALIRLATFGGLLAVVMLGALALHVPGSDTVGSHERANVFVGVLALGVGVYLLAVRLFCAVRCRRPPSGSW